MHDVRPYGPLVALAVFTRSNRRARLARKQHNVLFHQVANFRKERRCAQFKEYEEHAKQLERVAVTLDQNSAEYAALERAGWALAFVTMRHHREFHEFLEKQKRGALTSQELAHLKKLGLK